MPVNCNIPLTEAFRCWQKQHTNSYADDVLQCFWAKCVPWEAGEVVNDGDNAFQCFWAKRIPSEAGRDVNISPGGEAGTSN